MLSSCRFSFTCIHSLDRFTLRYLNKNLSPFVPKRKKKACLFFPFSFPLLLLLFLALWRITDKIHFCFVKYIDSAIWLQISVRTRLLPMHVLNNMSKRTWWIGYSVYFYSTMGQGPGTHDMGMGHRGQLLVLQLHEGTVLYSTSPETAMRLLLSSFWLAFQNTQ